MLATLKTFAAFLKNMLLDRGLTICTDRHCSRKARDRAELLRLAARYDAEGRHGIAQNLRLQIDQLDVEQSRILIPANLDVPKAAGQVATGASDAQCPSRHTKCQSNGRRSKRSPPMLAPDAAITSNKEAP